MRICNLPLEHEHDLGKIIGINK